MLTRRYEQASETGSCKCISVTLPPPWGPPSGPLGSPAATLSDLLPPLQAAPRLLSGWGRVPGFPGIPSCLRNSPTEPPPLPSCSALILKAHGGTGRGAARLAPNSPEGP